MQTEDAQAERKKRKSDLTTLRAKSFNVNCCYYCSDEDTAVLVEDLGRYGVAALPVLIEVLEELPFPSPLIAASGILGQMGSAAREAHRLF